MIYLHEDEESTGRPLRFVRIFSSSFARLRRLLVHREPNNDEDYQLIKRFKDIRIRSQKQGRIDVCS